MADVLFVLITVVFFSVAALFVRACGSIIGPEEQSSRAAPAPAADGAVTDGEERPMEAVL